MKTKILKTCFYFIIMVNLFACKPKPLSPNILIDGYKPFSGKSDFQILVSEKHPENQSMMFIKEKGEISFSFDDSMDGKKNVSLSAGVTENISAHAQLGENDMPEELMVIMSSKARGDQVLRDINLDGVWDIKIFPKQKQQYIFIGSDWKLVDRVEGRWPDINAKVGDARLIFDRTVNSWKESP